MTKLFILFLFSISTFGFNANFKFIKGDVRLNDKKVSSKNTSIEAPYIITTGDKSLAVIKINNSITLKLNKNSNVNLSEMKSLKDPSVELQAGSVFSFIKNKIRASKQNFSLKARSVSMGVKGTEFFTSFGKDGDLWMCVNEGTVAVSNPNSKQVTTVKQGEGVVIKNGDKTSAPKPLPWTRKLNWNYLADSNKELENKVSIQEAYSDLLDIDYE